MGQVERMPFAGSNLDKAREVYAAAIHYRLGIRLTGSGRVCWRSARRWRGSCEH
jgi:hypothetical protein